MGYVCIFLVCVKKVYNNIGNNIMIIILFFVVTKVSIELVDTWIKTEKEEIMTRAVQKGTAGMSYVLYEQNNVKFNIFNIEEIKKGLWSSVVRRQFLLQLKAKYSGLYSVCMCIAI